VTYSRARLEVLLSLLFALTRGARGRWRIWVVRRSGAANYAWAVLSILVFGTCFISVANFHRRLCHPSPRPLVVSPNANAPSPPDQRRLLRMEEQFDALL